MKTSNILIPMKLAGQGTRHLTVEPEAGYAMAALLVGLSVMAIMMTAAMPVWKQMNRREKEAELVFRGQQYVRAIGQYQRRSGPGTYPPNIDLLVEQHFLRAKYKDPITGEDFLLLPAASAAGAVSAAQTTANALQSSSTSQTIRATTIASSVNSTATSSGAIPQSSGGFATNVPGGIAGVVSKSSDTSIRVYNGRTHYNEWEFRYVAPAVTPAAAGAGAADGRGGRGQPQDGRGGADVVG